MAKTGDPSVDFDGMCEYLEETSVVFAVLFGSHARDAAGPGSDVDIALGFPKEMGDRERFRLRNRVDATLQQFAEDFVDVSDIDALPTQVAHAALRDGVVLVGGERTVETYRKRIADEYEATAEERERERREFIDRLARGDA